MQNILIKLLNGDERGGYLAGGLDPMDFGVTLWRNPGDPAETLGFAEIIYIKFLDPLESPPGFRHQDIYEKVSVLGGEHFHVRSRREDRFPLGFFAYPSNPNSTYSRLFFTAHGVTEHSHENPVGEILRAEGVLEKHDLDEALAEQRRLRQQRLGEILVKETPLTAETVEKTLAATQKRPPRISNIKVGELLVEAGLVTAKQVEEALATQSTNKRKRIGSILIDRGLISEDQLLAALAEKFCLQVVDLGSVRPSPQALSRISREIMTRLQVLPLELRNKRLVVATANPTEPTLIQNLHFATNCQIELVVASAAQIERHLKELAVKPDRPMEELLEGLTSVEVQVEDEAETNKVTESDSKVINIVNRILLEAHQTGVSDIHFEPGMGPLPLKVRYRKDGICAQVHQITAAYKAAIISRIKIMAKLDIAERRRPQSGKILIKYGAERIEYRLEVTPTIGGQEDAVLRVLSAARIFALDQMGFTPVNLKKMRELIGKPYGMILCVGPTGSGKTTSLHSALAEINHPERKIWTAEDPVEISQEGMRQVQVFPKIGFTFEEALRSFLRADPDVIMIGEMRDSPTAKTAIGAALTGHLVFSTLHTNNAPETIVRLIEMGVDAYNFADCMLGILAQRLTRALCLQCRKGYTPERQEYDELVNAYGKERFFLNHLPTYSKDLKLMRPIGCPACDGTGYRGRIAVHELLVNSPAVKAAIKQFGRVDQLERVALEEGMTTLRMDGIAKVFAGLTTMEQINRVAL